jgi:biopolymer transport protein TolR
MVPFIDVMLVLLIIFMVTAPLITPSMIALPKVGKAAAQPPSPVQIMIGKDETIQIKLKTDATPSNVDTVAADIARLEPKVKLAAADAVPVVISADKSIKYETVLKVMDNLQKAGVSRVGLSVQTSK